MISLWLNILYCNSPDTLSPDDWEKLRYIVYNMLKFDLESGESDYSKGKRFLNIFGFDSYAELKEKSLRYHHDINFVLRLKKASLDSKKSISRFCEIEAEKLSPEDSFRSFNGNILTHDSLRNEYRNALNRLKLNRNRVEDLFRKVYESDEYLVYTEIDEFPRSMNVRRKVRLSLEKLSKK